MDKKNFKEITVTTDCGIITVKEYDDEVANGVQIFLNDTIVAMVDCYRKETRKLPTELTLSISEFEEEFPLVGQITDILSDKYGFCVDSFEFTEDETTKTVHITQIVWDEDIPEARLLVYGPEGPDCDEPQECINLN